MTTTRHRNKPPAPAAPPPRHMLGERFVDPDLVDRIFDYLLELLPSISAQADDVKAAIRSEFGGVESYVRIGEVRQTEARERARKVLALFNGRNASEVARRLNISRATVYRCLKQPGGDPRP